MTEIQKTIIAQLGGNKMAAMIGLQSLGFYGDNTTTFKWAARGKRGINHLRVTLRPDDTYDMTFNHQTRFKETAKASYTGVYAEDLVRLFEETTGLYLTLFARR